MVIRLLARFFASWSTPALLRMGGMLGAIWFHVIRVRRGVAEQAVAHAFPEKSRGEVRAVVKANFQHLTTSLLESIAYIAYPESRLRQLIRVEGVEEAMFQPRAAGKGIVGISAHIGNFEMCTDAFGLLFELPMILVARLPEGGFARAMLDAFRTRNPRMEVFEPKGSAPKVVACLREKRSVLAFVIDQNLRRGRGIFLPFMGELANTTTGFASLQRKADAALCVVQIYREPDGTHRAHAKAVTPSSHPNQRIAMINDTLVMSNHIESYVRARPEQWFWVHRRWKARPESGDLVRTNAGLERFGRGRIAAFLGGDGAPDPESVRLLRDAGIAVFVVGTDVDASGVGGVIAGQHLDAASSLFWRTPGIQAEERTGDLRAVVDEFLERTVSAQKDEPS